VDDKLTLTDTLEAICEWAPKLRAAGVTEFAYGQCRIALEPLPAWLGDPTNPDDEPHPADVDVWNDPFTFNQGPDGPVPGFSRLRDPMQQRPNEERDDEYG
jgi:hypothetical protein